MKSTLVSALSACAPDHEKRKARRFLQGLSSDELQYIADFIGACILEAPQQAACCSRRQLAEGIAHFERRRHEARRPAAANDQDHKMILLLEYLCRCGVTTRSLPVGAGQA